MIIFVGPQGSGKGTQAQLLANRFNAVHLSTGEMLRQSTDPRVHAKLERGELFDDIEMTKVLREALASSPPAKNIILDGYPRNLNQVKLLDELQKQQANNIEGVIYLKLTDEEGIKRMLARGRADDTVAGIKQRLKQYKDETLPIIKEYKKRNLLFEIDGAGTVEQVASRIAKVVPWR